MQLKLNLPYTPQRGPIIHVGPKQLVSGENVHIICRIIKSWFGGDLQTNY